MFRINLLLRFVKIVIHIEYLQYSYITGLVISCNVINKKKKFYPIINIYKSPPNKIISKLPIPHITSFFNIICNVFISLPIGYNYRLLMYNTVNLMFFFLVTVTQVYDKIYYIIHIIRTVSGLYIETNTKHLG